MSIVCEGMSPERAMRRGRRRLLLGLGGLPVLGACALRPLPGGGPPAPAEIVPFSASPADGALPRGWVPYRVRRDIPESRYRTVADEAGTTVLRAESERGASGLRCALDADPAWRPWITWRWRAQTLPAGARADDLERDDSPARIVLAFDGDIGALPLRERVFFEQVELFTGQRLPYATLMYVWDATLPEGSVVPYGRSSRIRRWVVRSGPDGLGQWLVHRRNLVDDFRAAFGEAPGRLVSAGVLTDADDLQRPMRADYGDVVLSAA